MERGEDMLGIWGEGRRDGERGGYARDMGRGEEGYGERGGGMGRGKDMLGIWGEGRRDMGRGEEGWGEGRIC